MSNASQPWIVRVRGVPTDKPAEAERLVQSVLNEELNESENGTRTAKVSIVPSCRNDSKSVALINFQKPPAFLAELRTNPLGSWEAELDSGDDLTFDCHFHGFTQLYPTPPDAEITADIIAITGLGGHAYGSWRGKGRLGRMWLRDFFARDLPNCRTMIYGYNSKLSSPGADTILDYGRQFLEELKLIRYNKDLRERPLIFIAHSFGGIILAHSLVQALQTDERDDATIVSLRKAVYAILFFGTPHKGLVIDDMQRLLEANSPRSGLLEQLRPGTDFGRLQLANFKNLTRDLRIVSFYETQQTRQLERHADTQEWARTGPYVTAVTSDSALLELPDHLEAKIKVDADHSHMVKFNSKEDATYTIALSYLRNFEVEAKNIIGTRFNSSALSYHIPFSLKGIPVVRTFVDRPLDLQFLEHEFLFSPLHIRRKVVVLHGLGGIGKTQLTVEFLRRHHESFESVFWIDGESRQSLKQSFARCASRIPEGQRAGKTRQYTGTSVDDLDAVIRDVLEWLSKFDNDKWLLVFDNVDRIQLPDDPESYDIEEYLPEADHGSILITTRLEQLGRQGVSKQLGRVDLNQAHQIFATWYSRPHDPDEARGLLDLLDGLPLAIAQAGAYLHESNTSFQTYSRLYNQQWRQLHASQDQPDAFLQDYGNRSILTTWTLSYQAIQKRNKSAANLLLLWAWLNNSDLWYGLLSRASNRSREVARYLSDWLENIASNEVDFLAAMRLLCNFSMAENMQEVESFATHPVVHKWALHIQDQTQQNTLSQMATIVISSSVPHDTERGYSTQQRRLLPHAILCTKMKQMWLARPMGEPENQLSISPSRAINRTILLDALYTLGNLFYFQGKLAEAEQIYIAALVAYEESLGADHISTIKTVNNLGNIYSKQGKYTKAEEMYCRALKGKEQALGSDHRLTLSTVGNLGNIYIERGKLANAEQMYIRVLKGFEEALGTDHISTLSTVYNLGNLYKEQYKLAEAEQMYSRALDGYKKALGADDTMSLDMASNLGYIYRHQGKLAKAGQLYTLALEGYERALGTDDPSTLSMVNKLAVFYSEQGKLAEAEQLYTRALKGYEKALGANNIATLDVVNNLANLYYIQGKLAEARHMYIRALEVKEQTLGPEHTSTLDGVHNLACLYSKEGNMVEGEQMYFRALEGKKKTLGPDHKSTLNTIYNLAGLYFSQGKLAEAEQLYSRALESREKTLGAQHPATLQVMAQMAWTLKRQGCGSEALRSMSKCAELSAMSLGEEHPNTKGRRRCVEQWVEK